MAAVRPDDDLVIQSLDGLSIAPWSGSGRAE